MRAFRELMKDEAGASAAEYALILAIVGSAIALAAIVLGGEVAESMNETASCIEDSGACE